MKYGCYYLIAPVFLRIFTFTDERWNMSFFEKIKNIVVTIFPPIVMPQKRYVVLGVTIVYLIAKQIVAFTPSKTDDILLEQIHEAAFQIVQNSNKDETSV